LNRRTSSALRASALANIRFGSDVELVVAYDLAAGVDEARRPTPDVGRIGRGSR
jgi:hypothetical protein